MIKRYYQFKVYIFVPDGTGKTYGGVVMMSSIFPRPDIAYDNVLVGAMAEYKERYKPAEFDVGQMEMVLFERIK